MQALKETIKELFTRHPRETNETYGQHFQFASKTALKLLWAGFALMIHSIFPFLFTRTASRHIDKINQTLAARNK